MVLFKQAPLFKSVLRDPPDAAKSMIGQFLHPRAVDLTAVLERIPLDAPDHDRADLFKIKVPTLVMANRRDPIHPFEYGEILGCQIPGAEFVELTAKSNSVEQHQKDVQTAIELFCGAKSKGDISVEV